MVWGGECRGSGVGREEVVVWGGEGSGVGRGR